MDAQIGNLRINRLSEEGYFMITINHSTRLINIDQAEDLILFLQKEIANHELKKLTEKFTEGL
jgi:hypothetical protein